MSYLHLTKKPRLLAKLAGRAATIRRLQAETSYQVAVGWRDRCWKAEAEVERLDKENARLRPAYVALASVLRCIKSHRETYGYEKPDYILDMLEREFQEAEAALAAGENDAK